MKTNKAGLDLIKSFEGLRLAAYPDPATGGAPWTIGYGLTSAAGIVPVTKGMKITAAQAEQYLVQSLAKYEAAVSRALTRTPTDNQFAAMVSLCYNIGPGNFAGSTLVKRFNAGDTQGAANAFLSWNKAAGKVLPGLVRRREAERKLFGTAGSTAPSKPLPTVPAAAPRPSLWARIKALFTRS